MERLTTKVIGKDQTLLSEEGRLLKHSCVVAPRNKKNIAKGTKEPGISSSIVSHWGDEVTNKSIQRSKLGPIRIYIPPDK